MKLKKVQMLVCLTPPHGIDEASEAIAAWLENAGVDRRDILHSRMVLEELLLAVSTACGEKTRADISFAHSRLLIRYGGDRFNPVQHAQNEMETVSNEILSRAWLMPTWRWRGGANELRLYFRTKKVRPELVMLLCIAAAVLVGVLGNILPENIQDGMADYVLHFYVPSGNPPSGRSAWPAESGNPAAEINRCLQFQRQYQGIIKALLHN